MQAKNNLILSGLPSFAELSKAVKKKNSGIFLMNYIATVPINPQYIGNVRQGIIEFLNFKLLIFDDKLDGQPLAYDPNFEIFDKFGKIMFNDPRPHYRISVPLILLRIKVGSKLKAIVKMVEKQHCCVLIHNCIHATVYFPESHSNYYFSGLNPEQKIRFRVAETALHNCTLTIYGILTERYVNRYGKPQLSIQNESFSQFPADPNNLNTHKRPISLFDSAKKKK